MAHFIFEKKWKRSLFNILLLYKAGDENKRKRGREWPILFLKRNEKGHFLTFLLLFEAGAWEAGAAGLHGQGQEGDAGEDERGGGRPETEGGRDEEEAEGATGAERERNYQFIQSNTFERLLHSDLGPML